MTDEPAVLDEAYRDAVKCHFTGFVMALSARGATGRTTEDCLAKFRNAVEICREARRLSSPIFQRE